MLIPWRSLVDATVLLAGPDHMIEHHPTGSRLVVRTAAHSNPFTFTIHAETEQEATAILTRLATIAEQENC